VLKPNTGVAEHPEGAQQPLLVVSVALLFSFGRRQCFYRGLFFSHPRAGHDEVSSLVGKCRRDSSCLTPAFAAMRFDGPTARIPSA